MELLSNEYGNRVLPFKGIQIRTLIGRDQNYFATKRGLKADESLWHSWLIFPKYLTAGHVTVTGRSQPCESVRLPLACNSCVIVGLSLPPSGESVSVSSSPCHRNSFGLSHLGYLTVLRSFGDCTSLFWQPNLMNFNSVMAWLSEHKITWVAFFPILCFPMACI